MNQTFKDRVFIITGSTRGIGREIARQVLQGGGRVCLNGRSEVSDVIEKHFPEFSDRSLYCGGDMTRMEDAKKMVQKAIEKFGRIDVLITNAGMSGTGLFHESEFDMLKEVVNSNIFGSLAPVHAALPELIKSGGSVILVSSLAALHGIPEYSGYSIGKMALTAFWQSLRKELHHKNIFIGIAYVGFTENETEKKTYDTKGNLVSIQDRNKFKPATREQTAQKILKQLLQKRPLSVHSKLGKTGYYMSRFFPGITHKIFLRNYLKNNKKNGE